MATYKRQATTRGGLHHEIPKTVKHPPAAIPTVANRISGTIAEKEHLMGRLGFPELMIILVIVIIIFGANRLPQLGRGIGSAIKNFKDGMKDETTDLKS